LLPIVGIAAWCLLAGASPRAAAGESVHAAGWAPFDCSTVALGHRGHDDQHLTELATIPFPWPKSVDQFMANFRDWELRQTLAPGWKWVRHLPWIRSRFLTGDYGVDARAYFAGEVDATLDWVENWHSSRCHSEYEHLRYAFVCLVEKDSSKVRAELAFHADGVWAHAGHPVAPAPPLGQRLETFRRNYRTTFGDDPRDAQLVTFPSPLCHGVNSPCVAARRGADVIVGGTRSDRLYRFDRTQPAVTDVGVGDQRALAMIGENVARMLVPVPNR
jgi:hypothetical protein